MLVLPGGPFSDVVLAAVLPRVVVVLVVRGHGGAAADEAVGHVLRRAATCLPTGLIRLGRFARPAGRLWE